MQLSNIREKPIGGIDKKVGIYLRFVKRPMDVVLSFLALIVLSPLMVIIALLVRIKLGTPVIFKQARPGLNERIFTLYKFRTMTDEKDNDGKPLPDALRLTKFGRMLRSTSLDELPELVNIFKGDMSIIGPRPLHVRYLSRYNAKQRRRHDIRPGLSGYAQIYGRNSISWEERFELDIKYINNITFLGDAKIILITLNKAFKREGINNNGEGTMKEFAGSLESGD